MEFFFFQELKESFNYGLFCPPQNGKAGKFLDEERRLGDYPFNGPVGYLELKYKKRVYKMLNVDEKSLKSLHTRANYRRFLDYVNNAQVEKITKMCSKGFDPNFHCAETGGELMDDRRLLLLLLSLTVVVVISVFKIFRNAAHSSFRN